MPQQHIDYASPPSRPPKGDDSPVVNRRSASLATAVAAVIIFANFVLLADAAHDRSWGAIQIMIMIGPITNGLLLVASIACTPLVRRYTGGATTLHVLASLLLPLAAIMFDGIAIMSMNLHGC